MHIFGLRPVTINPSLQQSSLLEGCLHLTGNLQSGSHGGGQAGWQAGLGQAGAQADFGGQAGAQAGLHAGAQAGAHLGWHTGSHAGWHTGAQGAHSGSLTGAGCSQTGAVSQQLLLAQPTQINVVAHKKSNEAIIPSCFFIYDSFRFFVLVDLIYRSLSLSTFQSYSSRLENLTFIYSRDCS